MSDANVLCFPKRIFMSQKTKLVDWIISIKKLLSSRNVFSSSPIIFQGRFDNFWVIKSRSRTLPMYASDETGASDRGSERGVKEKLL
jgi:hypothetical protein